MIHITPVSDQSLAWLGHSSAMITATCGRAPPASHPGPDLDRWRAWAEANPVARAEIRRLLAEAFALADQSADRRPDSRSARPLPDYRPHRTERPDNWTQNNYRPDSHPPRCAPRQTTEG